jgi:hypothetical protein
MSLSGAGALFGIADPLKRVYDYLKDVKETREVRNQLQTVLQSLSLFASSSTASYDSAKALQNRADSLDPPISLQDVEDLLRLSTAYFVEYRAFLSSFCAFGKECNDLISGDFDVFMQKVRTRKPEIYEIMVFFGKNYDPKTGSLDLTRLPMFMRIYGKKGGWKESEEVSKEVAKGRNSVKSLMEKAKIIRTQRFALTDRALAMQYVHSLQRLGREAKRLRSSKETQKELKTMAPSWYVELTKVIEDVRKTLTGGARRALPR